MSDENIIPVKVDGRINRRSWALLQDKLADSVDEMKSMTEKDFGVSIGRLQAEAMSNGYSNVPSGYKEE